MDKKKKQLTGQDYLAMFNSGYTASGRRISDIIKPYGRKDSYNDFVNSLLSITRGENTDREDTYERINKARQNAYYAKQYIAQNSGKLDSKNGEGYSQHLLDYIESGIGELDTIQSRNLNTEIGTQAERNAMRYQAQRASKPNQTFQPAPLPEHLQKIKDRSDATVRAWAEKSYDTEKERRRQEAQKSAVPVPTSIIPPGTMGNFASLPAYLKGNMPASPLQRLEVTPAPTAPVTPTATPSQEFPDYLQRVKDRSDASVRAWAEKSYEAEKERRRQEQERLAQQAPVIQPQIPQQNQSPALKSMTPSPSMQAALSALPPALQEQVKRDAAASGMTVEEFLAKNLPGQKPVDSTANPDATQLKQADKPATMPSYDFSPFTDQDKSKEAKTRIQPVNQGSKVVTEIVKNAYDMVFHSNIDEEIKARAGNKGAGLLPSMQKGVVGAGAQFNDFILGIADNYTDFGKDWARLLGLSVNENWNPAGDLRQKNQEAMGRYMAPFEKDATWVESTIRNVVQNSVNSGAMIYMGTALGGAVGNAMGGGAGTLNSLLRGNQIANAVSATQMAPFALQSATEAYDQAKEAGLNGFQAVASALAAGMMSLATNTQTYEDYLERMGLGVQTNDILLAQASGSRIASLGSGALNWFQDAISMALKEGAQEVSESFALKLNSDAWNGTFFDATGWQEWSQEAKDEFFYGSLSGALFYASAIPSYAPSAMRLKSMVEGRVETTPETIADFVAQTEKDLQDPVIRDEVQTAIDSINETAAAQADHPEQTEAVDPILQAAQAAVDAQKEMEQQEQPMEETPAEEPIEEIAEEPVVELPVEDVEQKKPEQRKQPTQADDMDAKLFNKTKEYLPEGFRTSFEQGYENNKSMNKADYATSFLDIYTDAKKGIPLAIAARGTRLSDDTAASAYAAGLEAAMLANKPAQESSINEQAPALRVGMIVEHDGQQYEVSEISRFGDVHLDPLSSGYPVGRVEKIGTVMRWLNESVQQNTEKSSAKIYPAEKNGLPYDVVTEIIDTSKYEQSDSVASVSEESAEEPDGKRGSQSSALADELLNKFLRKGIEFNSTVLFEKADKAFGGTQGAGVYTPKDAYDAMELAVNRYLLEFARDMNGDLETVKRSLKNIETMLKSLPTQTKRTEEQQQYQQFSTPPNIAYLAAWSANIDAKDTVLEPSAGVGGLAVFPKAWGANVVVNELSDRRLALLHEMGFDDVYSVNAEQLDNALPYDVKPTVVIMNPPFSATAGRTSTNSTQNAKRHVDQALLRLEDGGRLVAVLGKGMADDAASFQDWFKKLRQEYDIRANIQVDGSNYKKYGTSWGVQIMVVDKTGPQKGKTITGIYKDLNDIPTVLEGIRNERKPVQVVREGKGSQSKSPVSGNPSSAGSPGGRHPVSDRSGGRDIGTSTGNEGQRSDAASIGSGNENNGSDVRGPRDGDRVSAEQRSEMAVQGNDNRERGLQRTGNAASLDRDQRSSTEETVSAGSSNGESDRIVRDVNVKQETVERTDSEDGVYTDYVPASLPIAGIKKHPAPLVESAAMAAVKAPKAEYIPNLPKNLIEKGELSGAQLEAIVYAGQSHSTLNEDGTRKGFFIGDGTGVGKGRTIAGIILDNFRQGRTKAVWFSKNGDLVPDAIRDWTALGGSKKDIIIQGKTKLKDNIKADSGIMFTPYQTLASARPKDNISRLQQLVDWLGKDFDGILAFDEVHIAGNLLGKSGTFGQSNGSLVAKAATAIQAALPKARIVYVSATGASDVAELSFASRLGLWGQGTAFNSMTDFMQKIGSAGLSAMELVARDMKAMGVYIARSIDYRGVKYDTLTHNLTPVQRVMYDTMSDAWQICQDNMAEALNITGGAKSGKEVRQARGQFYGAMFRFYNQIMTSMAMPSVIADMEKELAAGHSCVLQIVNTNEAEQERQLSKAKEDDTSIDDLDLTPRGTLLGYLEKSFPVQVYQEETDENGRTHSVPVFNKDGSPMLDRKAVAMRDALIERINGISIPDGPLEILLDAFGPGAVAEVTGRSRRVVKKTVNGVTTRVEEKRSDASNLADADAFQNGDKHILVFSDAGGTGKSYHADLKSKNQELRIHYLIQPGSSASKAVQGFGRTHRSNQKQAPAYKLVTTDVLGQKRFMSTIARRLEQLGALTKGQRDTGGGMFTAKDNLESPLAMDTLYNFYNALVDGKLPGLNARDVIKQMGMLHEFEDDHGVLKVPEETGRNMKRFLNRILSIRFDKQNQIFQAFQDMYEYAYENALQNGTLDMGLENVKADGGIKIIDKRQIRVDPKTGAVTEYVQAEATHKAMIIKDLETLKTGFVAKFHGLYRTNKGEVRAVYATGSETKKSGEVVQMYRIQSPTYKKAGRWNAKTLATNAQPIPESEWKAAWAEEVAKQPEYNTETIHMLTGALLPIWDVLPTGGQTKAVRLTADNGEQYLGRVISPELIDTTLGRLGAFERKSYTPESVYDQIMSNNGIVRFISDRLYMKSVRVNNEKRIELVGLNLALYPELYPGVFKEIIQYTPRYFIPNNKDALPIIGQIMKSNPVQSIGNGVESMVAEPINVLTANHGDVDFTVRKPSRMRLGDTEAMVRTKPEPKNIRYGYKVFKIKKDGQLYPPMAMKNKPTPVGLWLDAEIAPRKVDKDGNPVNTVTGRPLMDIGGGQTLAFRPGWHLGELPYAPQFYETDKATGEKLQHKNFVWAICEYAADVDYQEEAMSYGFTKNGKFKHSLAGLPALPVDGAYKYRTNPDPTTIPWVITGAMKVTRILTDEEVDTVLRENGVEPMKRRGGPIDLKKFGITERVFTKISEVERYMSLGEAGSAKAWTTDRVGDSNRGYIGIADIFGKIRHQWGIPVTKGNIRGKNVMGQYHNQIKSIRTRITNDLPVVSHELGHHLNKEHGVIDGMNAETRKEVLELLSVEIRELYANDKKQLLSEAFAEYIRAYLKNREITEIDFPMTTQIMTSAIGPEGMKVLNELADDVNAYYSLSADNAQSEIRLREEKPTDYRTLKEKMKDWHDRFYLAWVETNRGIRNLDKAVGSKATMLASNSAYADAVAGQVLTGELRDPNGQLVSVGLQQALEGVDIGNKEEYKAFGEYLAVRHGPEWLREGRRVFANDAKNSTAWMEQRQAELEAMYPDFKEASERLYTFQRDFLQAWGVNTGLVSAHAANEWAEKWENYVPFNRWMDDDRNGIGAKRGYANQNSTIRKGKGSGRDLIHPVDNIITNVIKMVNAGLRNQVMYSIAEAVDSGTNTARFMEKIPTPMVPQITDLRAIKSKLAKDMVESGKLGANEEDVMLSLISKVDDLLVQFSQGRPRGDVVTVLRGGEPVFYKVNDPLLLKSIANLNPKQANAIMDAYGHVTRFITGNITGRNVIWSIFSNLPRDAATFMAYSKDKNPLHMISGVASAYANKMKGKNADPMYLEYLAMGGGKTSAYTADKNLQKKIREKLAGNKNAWKNPLEWLDFISDTIESGPRYATYKMMRDQGLSPQEAFYESNDITVNFRRGGTLSRSVNQVIPFFNAGVQGIDKFARWITAEDATPANRKKTAAIRATTFVTASLILAALSHAINGGDDEKKKDYAQLSTYTKNNFFTIPMGNGKYFSIPKPRELAVLTSLFERMMEFWDGNEKAFSEFYNYLASTTLPNAVSGLAQADTNDAMGSMGLFGVVYAMNANKDFLGRPIESAGMVNLEPSDRFTNRTSRVAKIIGDALELSPIKIDYAMQNILGGFWKWNQALFPVGSEARDFTLGVKNTYVKDNQFSTDIINDIYTSMESISQSSKSHPSDIGLSFRLKMATLATDFYSQYNKLSKNEPETDQSRHNRQVVLDMLDGMSRYLEGGRATPELKALQDYVIRNGGTEHYPSSLTPRVKDESGVVHDLNASQFVDFQLDYNTRYWNYVDKALSKPETANEAGLQAAKNVARAEANAKALAAFGKTDKESRQLQERRNVGISAQTDLAFTAAKDKANEDGSFTKIELLDILEGLNATEQQKAVLYAQSNGNSTLTSNPYTSVADLNEHLLTTDKPDSAKQSLTQTYKELILRRFEAGDEIGMYQYIDKLLALDVYDKKGKPYYTMEMINKWIDDYLKKDPS